MKEIRPRARDVHEGRVPSGRLMSSSVPSADAGASPVPDPLSPAEKVKQFPAAPGVYLMKDAQGRVIYVGKAKNLRNRASHYFTQAAAEDLRTADLVKLIADIDFLQAESEVEIGRA